MSSEQSPNHGLILAEGERIVRQYACTRFVRLLAPPTIGYLSVTNKRIVYHYQVKSLAGMNTITSEIPIDDVSGITTALTFSLNLVQLIIFGAIVFFVTQLIMGILGSIASFLVSWVVIILLSLPYLVSLLFTKNILNPEMVENTMKSLDESGVGEFINKRSHEFYIRVFKGLAIAAMIMAAGKLTFGAGLGVLGFIPMIAIIIYLYSNAIRRFKAFSLQIGSRTNTDGNGIVIPGGGFLMMLTRNFAEIRAIWASPAQDAVKLVEEIGAMVTDIRLLGEIGVDKWTSIKDQQPLSDTTGV